MSYALRSFHDIEPHLLPAVARLHQSTLPILLSDMGYPFVLRYFQAAARDQDVVGFYAVSDEGRLIGYVVGTPRPGDLNSKITRPLPWFALQCLRLLLTKPAVLFQAVVSSMKVAEQTEEAGDAIEVVYVSVDPAARGQGAGRSLMRALHDASRAAGYKRVTASQELDNEPGIRLLASMGYRPMRTFREGRYHRQRVELAL